MRNSCWKHRNQRHTLWRNLGGVPAHYIMKIEEYRDKLIGNKDKFDLQKLSENKEIELTEKLKP